MSLSVMVFDVGRGLCIAIRTPNNHLVLIDCGNSDELSPVVELARQRGFWAGRNGYPLTQLIVTHPHNDHIADIEQISRVLQPSIIVRRKEINWDRVLSGNTASNALQHYWQNYFGDNYSAPVPTEAYPDWGDGMTLSTYWLNEPSVARISATDNSYVNNTSIVTILKYRGYTFAFLGDNETDGLDMLLAVEPSLRNQIGQSRDLLNNLVGGVHFLVTAHHGHPSGFSTNWFDLTGPTHVFNIVSERRLGVGEDASRANVDSRYSAEGFSSAGNREDRRMISTRNDGNILITVEQNGQWRWQTVN